MNSNNGSKNKTSLRKQRKEKNTGKINREKEKSWVTEQNPIIKQIGSIQTQAYINNQTETLIT